MNMIDKVKLTDDHLSWGERDSETDCAVALALKDHYREGANPLVGSGEVVVFGRDYECDAYLSAFIEAWEELPLCEGLGVEPDEQDIVIEPVTICIDPRNRVAYIEKYGCHF